MRKIAITMGDSAGIGPEIILKALETFQDYSDFVLIGSKKVFQKQNIEIIDIPCDMAQIKIGKPSLESGKASYLALKKACDIALEGQVQAIVTAPLSKHAINLAGYNYSGQTEILEENIGKLDNSKAEMLFVAKDFRVLLLTRHIKLIDVPSVLSEGKIIESISILIKSLQKNFKIDKPKIAVCGLNPHAGEDGLLGDEEQNIIIPAIKKLKQKYGLQIDGPFPADTLFVKAGKAYNNNEKQPYDAYVSCYHDQGLIPIKLLAMDFTVNTTINLPVIRTSPAHGTAFDIAGKNVANPQSMIEAMKLAKSLV